MAFTLTAADLYLHGARQSYWTGVDAGAISAALSAALGECSRKLSPRVGGPAAQWSFSDPAGEEECKRDVCIVAMANLIMSQGAVLPSESTDQIWVDQAQSVRKLWSKMGAPSIEPDSEPLYSGLADSTPAVTEGAAGGWSTPYYQDFESDTL
jgi:hypothetical protein